MVEVNLSSGQGWDLTPGEFRWRGDDLGYLGSNFASPKTKEISLPIGDPILEQIDEFADVEA